MNTKAGLTIPEACDRYSISRTKLYDEIRAGRLRITKIGRRSVVAVIDGDAWFEALRNARSYPT